MSLHQRVAGFRQRQECTFAAAGIGVSGLRGELEGAMDFGGREHAAERRRAGRAGRGARREGQYGGGAAR